MNIFDQYGIKDVCEGVLYSIHKKKDGSGEIYYVPALYLDTLKVSSVDKAAENTWATGGLGNSRLICWDFGKEINVSLEDALCTPASLGLCWGGILSTDWKENEISQDYGITSNKKEVEKISRMEKVFYPKGDRQKIGNFLPHLSDDPKTEDGLPLQSSIIDGTIVEGFGYVKNKSYKWNMAIESDIKSISVVPNKFFDVYGNSYPIIQKVAIGIRQPSSTDEFKLEIIYKINNAPTVEEETEENIIINVGEETLLSGLTPILEANYLKIRVDNNDNYSAYLGTAPNIFDENPTETINTSQFKGIDMWNKFNSINELIYFIITKYEDNILSIAAATIEDGGAVGTSYTVESSDLTSQEIANTQGKLWSFVSPKNLAPYDDDYWFSQGESYYIKTFTLAARGKKLKAKRIEVTASQFPGMYMFIGETYIRQRETGEDERVQLKFPLCKVKSEQSLTLEADGEPTVFNLNLEVAKPVAGSMMEITFYDVEKTLTLNEDNVFEIKDGSTRITEE